MTTVVRQCVVCGKFKKHGEWVSVDADIVDAIKKLDLKRVLMLIVVTCPSCEKEEK